MIPHDFTYRYRRRKCVLETAVIEWLGRIGIGIAVGSIFAAWWLA